MIRIGGVLRAAFLVGQAGELTGEIVTGGRGNPIAQGYPAQPSGDVVSVIGQVTGTIQNVFELVKSVVLVRDGLADRPGVSDAGTLAVVIVSVPDGFIPRNLRGGVVYFDVPNPIWPSGMTCDLDRSTRLPLVTSVTQ